SRVAATARPGSGTAARSGLMPPTETAGNWISLLEEPGAPARGTLRTLVVFYPGTKGSGSDAPGGSTWAIKAQTTWHGRSFTRSFDGTTGAPIGELVVSRRKATQG